MRGLPKCKSVCEPLLSAPDLTSAQAEKMDVLEKTQSWKEEEFDVVLQFMRTILLRRKSILCLGPSWRKILIMRQTALR